MRRVVEPHLVEQDAGLVGATAAHVESTAKIRCRLHARQQLQTAQQVRLGHGRHLLDIRYLQGDHARPLIQFARRARCGLHHDLPISSACRSSSISQRRDWPAVNTSVSRWVV